MVQGDIQKRTFSSVSSTVSNNMFWNAGVCNYGSSKGGFRGDKSSMFTTDVFLIYLKLIGILFVY